MCMCLCLRKLQPGRGRVSRRGLVKQQEEVGTGGAAVKLRGLAVQLAFEKSVQQEDTHTCAVANQSLWPGSRWVLTSSPS